MGAIDKGENRIFDTIIVSIKKETIITRTKKLCTKNVAWLLYSRFILDLQHSLLG